MTSEPEQPNIEMYEELTRVIKQAAELKSRDERGEAAQSICSRMINYPDMELAKAEFVLSTACTLVAAAFFLLGGSKSSQETLDKVRAVFDIAVTVELGLNLHYGTVVVSKEELEKLDAKYGKSVDLEELPDNGIIH